MLLNKYGRSTVYLVTYHNPVSIVLILMVWAAGCNTGCTGRICFKPSFEIERFTLGSQKTTDAHHVSSLRILIRPKPFRVYKVACWTMRSRETNTPQTKSSIYLYSYIDFSQSYFKAQSARNKNNRCRRTHQPQTIPEIRTQTTHIKICRKGERT